ncbi:MAG: hypothetical protein SGARI_006965, partial [Bacillariaceae sp.]
MSDKTWIREHSDPRSDCLAVAWSFDNGNGSFCIKVLGLLRQRPVCLVEHLQQDETTSRLCAEYVLRMGFWDLSKMTARKCGKTTRTAILHGVVSSAKEGLVASDLATVELRSCQGKIPSIFRHVSRKHVMPQHRESEAFYVEVWLEQEWFPRIQKLSTHAVDEVNGTDDAWYFVKIKKEERQHRRFVSNQSMPEHNDVRSNGVLTKTAISCAEENI